VSHGKEHHGWRGFVVQSDDKVPWILWGVLIGMFLFTTGELLGMHFQHYFHHEIPHFLTNHMGMLYFFAFLGLEVTIKKLKAAGRFVIFATIGGMIIPPLCAYALTQNFYIALGACATDVAFSLGAWKMAKGTREDGLKFVYTALLILAVGDDLGGVMMLAAFYATAVTGGWLIFGLMNMIFSYACGEKGEFTVKWVPMNLSGEELTEWKATKFNVLIEKKWFWILFAAANCGIMWAAGVEWILGACLIFILAPDKVKEELIHMMKPFIPIILFFFGGVNGAINVFDLNNWGWITAGSAIGGFGGKIIGIFGGGMLGRWQTKKKDPNNDYANIPTRRIAALALFGAANGTVAIFFVSMGAARGFIEAGDAKQAILGYFLTVGIVYGLTFIGNLVDFFGVKAEEIELNSQPATT
jgi:hypothetical protein